MSRAPFADFMSRKQAIGDMLRECARALDLACTTEEVKMVVDLVADSIEIARKQSVDLGSVGGDMERTADRLAGLKSNLRSRWEKP